LALILFVSLVGVSSAAEYWLRAGTFSKTLPDGQTITMWGYALDQYNIGSGNVAGDGIIRVPGPILTVPPGQGLTVHLTNNLPVPTSIVIPGQPGVMSPVWINPSTGLVTSTGSRNPGDVTSRMRSLTQETNPGATGDYVWNNVKTGTYLYKSGTHQQVQVQMGLYGAMKKDAAAGQAYTGLNYDVDQILLFSELDPVIANAVSSGAYGTPPAPTSTIDHQPKYFFINGESFSYGQGAIPIGNPSQRTLLRFLNAGYEDYVPVFQGPYMEAVAEDGNLYPFSRKQYSIHLAPGRTTDVLLANPAEPGYLPLYERGLHLTNSVTSPGGMLVYLRVASDPQYTLNVSKAGAGTGRVVTMSLPGGIDCGLDCSETMNSGVDVSLRAIPNPGSTFTGWSGSITATTSDITLTMDSNKAAVATFALGPSITLTSPNGGEVWQRGQTQTISWTYSGALGPSVQIRVIKGTSAVTVARRVSIGTNGAGSFNWRISRFLRLTGSDLKVRITSSTTPTLTDTSDNFFTINR